MFDLPRAGAVCLVLATLTVPSTAQDEHRPDDKTFVKWSDIIGEGSSFQLYGFLRTDAQWNDSRMNDPQIPGYVRSEDPTAPPSIGAPKDDSEFALHARLTRLGLDFTGPDIEALGKAKLTGNVEIDFYNIGLPDSDSRAAVRMRKAYLQLAWDDVSVLAGQTWDLISPLYPAVNADLVMWGAGNLGDRRPQIRASYTPEMAGGKFDLTGGIGLAGAVAGKNVVGGLRSGENSGLPMFAARAGWSKTLESGGKVQAGVWGHYSEDRYDPAGGTNEETFKSHSVGFDVKVPILGKELWLLGEGWTGENLDDVRGGIFQGVNATTRQGIGASGGFGELGWQTTETMSLHAGYSTDNPKDSDLSPTMRSNNKVYYATAKWRFDAFRMGVEYLNWTTDYIGFSDGTANRVVFWVAYYF